MTKNFDHLNFITPPENQGQIVDSSFAIDAEREEIVNRTFDGSDGSESYAVTPITNLVGKFEPWNHRPKFADDGLWEPAS
jgi:hypothetical protein